MGSFCSTLGRTKMRCGGGAKFWADHTV